MDTLKTSHFDEHTKSVLKETHGQLNDYWEFDFEIDRLAHWSGFPRIITWLEFFNTHYYTCILCYTKLISSLLKVAQKNPLFCGQSKHEQAISFKFYKSLFQKVKVLQLHGESESDYLFTLSLIFGRYPGMVRNSLNKGIPSHKSIELTDLHKLFKHLFIRYENVNVLTNNLCVLRLSEIEFLMWMIQGNSIRHFKNIPIPLSKKETYLFTQSSDIDWGFEEDVLERSIIVTKFLKIKNDPNLVRSFLQENQIFEYRLFEFWKDVTFWYQVYRVMATIDWRQSRLSLKEYIDYFVYKRTNSNKEYEIKGRTTVSLERAVLRWHGMSDFYLDTKLLLLDWGKPQINKVNYNNRVYVFEEITNGNRLFQESETMKHCVFTYVKDCNARYFKIWNLSVLGDIKKSLLTIQTRGNEIIQIGGKCNKEASKLQLAVVEKWAFAERFIFNTDSNMHRQWY